MNTVCLTHLWGLGPKPEQGDLCHPDCARLKVTGQLVDKMQLYQRVQCRTGRGRLLLVLFSGGAVLQQQMRRNTVL